MFKSHLCVLICFMKCLSNTQFCRKWIRKIDSRSGHDIRNSPDISLSCPLLMRRRMMMVGMMMMVMTAGYISVPTDVMGFLGRLHNSQRSAAGLLIILYGRTVAHMICYHREGGKPRCLVAWGSLHATAERTCAFINILENVQVDAAARESTSWCLTLS